MKDASSSLVRISTGIASLDDIICGGLPEGEIYVVNGEPGTGKTILGLHFLRSGVEADEKVLCIALSQRVQSIKQTATSVGIDPDGIVFEEFGKLQALEATEQQQTIFDTSDLELETTMTQFIEVIEAVKPRRVIFDSIAYLRMLANDKLVYRRNLLLLRDYMHNRNITIMLTDDQKLAPGDCELVSIAHGVINLSRVTTTYSQDYRYLQVSKLRGSNFQSGIHDMEITSQGMNIYHIQHQAPHLISQTPNDDKESYQPMSSGIDSFDKLIGGYLLTGTSSLLIGPSGTGKTTLASLFIHNFISQGGKASVFLFDELASTFLKRSEGLDIGLNPQDYPDQIRIRELGLSNSNPGKFRAQINEDVKEWGAKIVLIDSLTGYANSMPSNEKLVTLMHDLLIMLNRQNVLTLLVVAQHGVIGDRLEGSVDISYLADSVLLLRHFEAKGAIHKAIGVYKKRYGAHEKGIREIRFDANGIHIGDPLEQFSGILSGIPKYIGEPTKLIENDL